MLQYGFVTLFAVAFPLAPFFAFLNNLLEMRCDSAKFIVSYRRPFARITERDIGAWYSILYFISRLSVLTNVSLSYSFLFHLLSFPYFSHIFLRFSFYSSSFFTPFVMIFLGRAFCWLFQPKPLRAYCINSLIVQTIRWMVILSFHCRS